MIILIILILQIASCDDNMMITDELCGKCLNVTPMSTALLLLAKINMKVFSLSEGQTTRNQWMEFFFINNVPVTLPATVHVCAKHCALECLTDLGQYQGNMASTLCLERGMLPTVRDSPGPRSPKQG